MKLIRKFGDKTLTFRSVDDLIRKFNRNVQPRCQAKPQVQERTGLLLREATTCVSDLIGLFQKSNVYFCYLVM